MCSGYTKLAYSGEVKTKAADSTPCLDAGLDLLVLDATQLRPGNH
jgi:hypothetical protein